MCLALHGPVFNDSIACNFYLIDAVALNMLVIHALCRASMPHLVANVEIKTFFLETSWDNT